MADDKVDDVIEEDEHCVIVQASAHRTLERCARVWRRSRTDSLVVRASRLRLIALNQP
jgi:hypothetical protein